MRAIIDHPLVREETHRVGLIAYRNNVPRHIITEYEGRYYWWDGFIDSDSGGLKLYQSGSGPAQPYTQVQATVWHDPALVAIGEVQRTLKYPRRLKIADGWHAGRTTINPFHAGDLADNRNSCEICGYESENEECPAHYWECWDCQEYGYTDKRIICRDCGNTLCAECYAANGLCERCHVDTEEKP